MKKMFDNNKMMLLFIGVFVIVFGIVVSAFGKKTYSVTYVCSDQLATLKDGKCIITRYVDCNENNEAICRVQLPNDGYSCEYKSVTEEDGGYNFEYLCTKNATVVDNYITELTLPVSQVVCPSDSVYDGSIKTITVPNDSKYDILISNSETGESQVKNVGSYVVKAKIKDMTKYKWPGTESPTVTLKTCIISSFSSKVSLSETMGTGKNGYLTSTNINVNSKCDGKISISTKGLTPMGTIAGCPCALSMDSGSRMLEANFKVETTCNKATATIKFISDSDNCSDATATYTYTVEDGKDCDVQQPSSSSKPSSSSSSSKSSSSSSSSKPSSSSNNNDVTPITSIILGNETLCIDGQTSLLVSSTVSGEIIVVNDNSEVVKLSSSTYDLTANEEKVFKLLGLKIGETNIKVRFIPDDITKYEVIEKDYTVMVGNCGGNENIEKNPTTGSIMLFIVWVIGFGAIGYSFYTFRYNFKN